MPRSVSTNRTLAWLLSLRMVLLLLLKRLYGVYLPPPGIHFAPILLPPLLGLFAHFFFACQSQQNTCRSLLVTCVGARQPPASPSFLFPSRLELALQLKRIRMFPESHRMFPESHRMFPESHRMFPESHWMFPESHRMGRLKSWNSFSNDHIKTGQLNRIRLTTKRRVSTSTMRGL
jgi:hypothetical protein